ncbi:TetR/AcrR family transcriptional regulator [Conexibacter woesei]|uniref:Transcriptional regulator, TetR family n=1 Tax=Conexibacter woesei (strain DSM 14684 / CCUG 47730 / CIP 108061 / JCM 11494 / NBRC 100937 / ID131577) TaxID=469383 RepID=D3F5J3_CONWI|nr:TetR/AcrR family transcriptional regulator [Conexibacter woesei]ADB50660.1 transcriptional regulator, TetR family [Conexibacter woesei DSM 14684]
MASTTPARRARSERTELHLLRTATWLFSERGFHGTSIRDIADTAGVAVSAMYYYAASKDELLVAVMRQALERLLDASARTLEGLDGPSERLATLIGVHVALHARNPRTAGVADHELRALARTTRRAMLAERDAYEATWVEVLREGAETGEFADRGGVDRLALLQMCTGVAQWYKPRGDVSIPELCARFADMGLALSGARRGGRPVVVGDLEIPSPDLYLPLVEIRSEPRRKPARS